jgi:hypothetical protein
MTDLLIDVNGETVLLDSCGAAFLPAQSTLVFADLHFEKGSSYARGRQFLPPYDTVNTLLRMVLAVARHGPALCACVAPRRAALHLQRAGALHVHFPRLGFDLSRAG